MRMMMAACALAGWTFVLGYNGPAHADVALSGTFTATQACPAYQSVRWFNNAGSAAVAQGQTYAVLAKNKPDVTYYRIRVEGAKPQERWVWAACGHFAPGGSQGAAPPATAAAPDAGAAPAAAPGFPGSRGARATHVLALGWEPAFCAKHKDKSECRSLTAASFGATHLSLHGLWPQPRGTQYCNVAPDIKQRDEAHDWNALPEPELSNATRQRLAAVMPGVASNLQRHEWIVHGTCHGTSADAYFARAASLAEAVAASKVATVFADSAGQSLSAATIRAAFDDAFGPGAGARVTVSCRGRGTDRKITEIVLSLAGDVSGNAALGDLMRATDTVPQGCPSGIVDRVSN